MLSSPLFSTHNDWYEEYVFMDIPDYRSATDISFDKTNQTKESHTKQSGSHSRGRFCKYHILEGHSSSIFWEKHDFSFTLWF